MMVARVWMSDPNNLELIEIFSWFCFVLLLCAVTAIINDISDFTNVVVSLSAYDLKMYTELFHPDTDTNFQSHLSHIQNLANENLPW